MGDILKATQKGKVILMKNNTALQVKNLTKRYGGKEVVSDVSISVARGEIYGLVGKNGAGKTTILRMVCGLAAQTQGEIELFGSEKLGEERRRIGSIIETPSFYPYLSARDNLEYYRRMRGIPEKGIVDEVLEIVGLSDTGKKKFKNFSLGMKQKLGFALAIMGNPDMLILDEPTNGLDPMGIVDFRELLLRINRERGITIIISSHILSELSQLATTYGFIDQGKMVQQISAAEMINSCRRCIELKVDDPDKAAALLESRLSCTDYEVLSEGSMRVYQGVDHPELVNETLVEGGVMVSRLGQTGANLENYFIDLVGGAHHA